MTTEEYIKMLLEALVKISEANSRAEEPDEDGHTGGKDCPACKEENDKAHRRCLVRGGKMLMHMRQTLDRLETNLTCDGDEKGAKSFAAITVMHHYMVHGMVEDANKYFAYIDEAAND